MLRCTFSLSSEKVFFCANQSPIHSTEPTDTSTRRKILVVRVTVIETRPFQRFGRDDGSSEGKVITFD